MRTKLSILGTSFLLPMMTLQAATESSVPASFRIEVLVRKVASTPASIPVECLYGCAWDKQTIECPAAIKECRAIIDGRFGIEPWTKEAAGVQAVLPLSGTVCLGVATRNAQSAAEQGFSEPDRSAPAGAIAWQVDAGSPAEVAGIKTGDLFLVSTEHQSSGPKTCTTRSNTWRPGSRSKQRSIAMESRFKSVAISGY